MLIYNMLTRIHTHTHTHKLSEWRNVNNGV